MCDSIHKGRAAMGIGTLLIIGTIGVSVFIGMASLTFYTGNDPFCKGEITYPDALVPKLGLVVKNFENHLYLQYVVFYLQNENCIRRNYRQ
jgi:hypothetical protein